MAPRRRVIGGALALVVALVGCGRKQPEVVVADPTAEALAFAPAAAALVAVVATDPAGGPGAALVGLAERLPGASLAVGQARAALSERTGVAADAELAPLLGNPLVAWTPRAGDALRAAWVVRDGARLGELLEAAVQDGRLRRQEAAGEFERFTTVPQGTALARRGPILVLAPDAAALTDALARRAAADAQYGAGLLEARGLGLPQGAAVRVLADASALRLPERVVAVPWVQALDRLALTVHAEPGGLRLRARGALDRLPADALPIAPGAGAPEPRGTGPIVVALRDPAPALRTLRAAIERADPERLRGLAMAEEALERFARVSLEDDLLAQLTGTAIVTTADRFRTLALRADLRDPGRTRDALERLDTLARLGGPLASLAGVDTGGYAVAEPDPGRYVLTRQGTFVVGLGVVDDVLALTTDPDADLAAIAVPVVSTGDTGPAQGALRATLTDDALEELVLERFGLPDAARIALGPLGDVVLTGRAETTRLDLEAFLPVAGS